MKGAKGFQRGNQLGKKFDSENQPESNGRIPGIRNRSTIAKKWLECETDWINPFTGEKEKLSLEDQITLAQIKAARDDASSIAYKNVMDSRFGAVQQKIDLNQTGDLLIPNINIYNNAPPLAESEDQVDGNRQEQDV